jgi:hypothetical protein
MELDEEEDELEGLSGNGTVVGDGGRLSCNGTRAGSRFCNETGEGVAVAKLSCMSIVFRRIVDNNWLGIDSRFHRGKVG